MLVYTELCKPNVNPLFRSCVELRLPTQDYRSIYGGHNATTTVVFLSDFLAFPAFGLPPKLLPSQLCIS